MNFLQLADQSPSFCGTCYLGSRQRNLETFVLHRNASVPELPETDSVDAISLVAFEFNPSLDPRRRDDN